MTGTRPLRLGDPPRLGDYRLESRLGEGGQGVVYLGRDPGGRPVAVKLLRAGLDAASRERFTRELAVIERVAGFCTARVLDAGVAEDQPYIVSEYVPGPSLQELVAEQGPREGGDLERLTVGTATALAAVHRAGIVHRDFKPANVLMGPDGPRVIDFGIARALDAGAASATASGVVGTPAYMAPEQIAGKRVVPATDVFAWAATMAYAATGRSPFQAGSIPSVINRITHDAPDLTGVPAPLRDVLSRCLAKDPASRPAAEHLLSTLLGQEPAPAPPAPPPYGAGPPGSGGRRTAWIVAGAAALALVVAVAAAGVWLFTRSRSAPLALPPGGAALMRTASSDVETVTSYDYRRLDADERAAHAVMTPAMRKRYDDLMTRSVAPEATRQKAVNQASVLTAGLESTGDDAATALVVVRQASTRDGAATPGTSTSAVRVGLTRQGGKWLLDRVTPAPAAPAAAAGASWPGPEPSAVLAAGRSCVTAMHAIDYRTIDGTVAAVAKCGTGGFRTQWTKSAAKLRASVVRQKVVDHVTRVEPALTSVSGTRAGAVVAVSATVRTASGRSARTSLYQLTLTRTGGKWLVSALSPLTYR